MSASLVRDPAGIPMYVVHQIEDITARRRDGERLAHQAIHDPLTGLPNRLFFVDRLRRALSSGMNSEWPHRRAVPRPRPLQDHQRQPRALRRRPLARGTSPTASATRCAPHDTVARFGGDEFTVALQGRPRRDVASEIADRIGAAVAKPVMLDDGEVYVTASVGIALSSGDIETPETLLRNADAAMYAAKDLGRARAELYDTGSRDRAVRYLRTGNELHRALERGEMRVFYQPIMSLETQRIAGFEALVRWEHPERGLVGPDRVHRRWPRKPGSSCRSARGCSKTPAVRRCSGTSKARPITISVNLSPRQLAEPDPPRDDRRGAQVDWRRPRPVWLEITETTLMRDAESAVSMLHALTALGVHLSVDDFGTGYSSMTYLKRFPVEALKVDRSFVDGLGHGTRSDRHLHRRREPGARAGDARGRRRASRRRSNWRACARWDASSPRATSSDGRRRRIASPSGPTQRRRASALTILHTA